MSSMVKLINLVINANCSIRNFSFVSCNNYNLRFWNHTCCAKLQLNRLLISDDRFNTQTFCRKLFYSKIKRIYPSHQQNLVKIRYDLWEYFLSLIKKCNNDRTNGETITWYLTFSSAVLFFLWALLAFA